VAESKVEFQPRWILLLLSAGVLYTLRNHRLLLAIYVGLVIIGVLLYALWLPRRVQLAEKRFSREALRLLARDDLAGLDGLAKRQWLIRRFGRKYLIPDTLAMAASAADEHAMARQLYLEAMRDAPPDERMRIELNLARSEHVLGQLDTAEGRLRSLLARRPALSQAQGQLGQILVAKGESLSEAAELLNVAVEACDPRMMAALQLARAEALARTGQASDSALSAAASAGADEAEVARVKRLSRSQSATRG
jgi:tetratricopeptide (TPR) repeat protein